MVRQTMHQISEDMPEGYYQQLPKLTSAPMTGFPRVYALACALIQYDDGRLDLDRVTRFVHTYQQVTPLTMGELWALPTMLRLGLLELMAWAVARATELDIDVPQTLFLDVAPSSELSSDTAVANCITGLRFMATQDWEAFFETVSLAEEALSADPVGIYTRMDFETRDRYRKVVEDLARDTGRPEEDVAQEATDLARAQSAPEMAEMALYDIPRDAHVGFYLLDEGREQLEAQIGYVPAWHVRLRRWLLNHAEIVYLGAIILLTLAVVAGLIVYASTAGGTVLQLVAVALLSVIPVSAIAVSLVNWIVTHIVPSRTLPKMDFRHGIPEGCRTMVVIPALLSSENEVESLLRQLELHFLGNTDPHLTFALLTDFSDAPRVHMDQDDALLDQAKAGIKALNRKYAHDGAHPFYLFHRRRLWNPNEEQWMGWERKRGKLGEFNRLLRGDKATSFIVTLGDLDVLSAIRYVITLDADTALPRESARRLVATLAHPLNRAQFDPDSGRVTAGYTVLQPRTEIGPSSVNRSPFSRIFSGDIGLDLYTRAVSDVYQDLFGEGSYVGKGIYDVDAFERSLAGCVPENALLSHDLFEGVHGRAGLVTDVILYEDYPPSYLTYQYRLHRWVRGDWQLLPWLFPRVPHAGEGTSPNRLSLLDRWKIFDNMRRSLFQPALVAFMLTGWLWLPGSAWLWTLVAVIALAFPVMSGFFDGMFQHLGTAMSTLRLEVLRFLLRFAFLLYEAVLMADAIGATLVHLTITHKHMLQWTTSAHTVRLFGMSRKLAVAWRRMRFAPFLALIFALLLVLFNPVELLVAAPILIGWLLSPWIAYWISKPETRQERPPLSTDQSARLRRLARCTWFYFEQFVGPEDHWLPPDHFQEQPRGVIAHRTSPTNIGLLLLSTLAAYEMGYIGPMDLTLRLRGVFDTLDELERYRGHLLNWYDTHTLKPLLPRYVSTVDSGNLAACLLALQQGLQALAHQPAVRWQYWRGLLDTLDVLDHVLLGLEKGQFEDQRAMLQAHLSAMQQQVLAAEDAPGQWFDLLVQLLDEQWPKLEQLLVALLDTAGSSLDVKSLHGLRLWTEQVHHRLLSVQNELELLLPWQRSLKQVPPLLQESGSEITQAWEALEEDLRTVPALDEVARIRHTLRQRLERLEHLLDERLEASDSEQAEGVKAARAWFDQLIKNLDNASGTAQGLAVGLQDLGNQAMAYFAAMDFEFLFDTQRQVFHIGYDLQSGALSTSYYDLLASEARIASLVAIAKGDVPQSHWLHMSRPLVRVDDARALLSWNGSMFEYLMPPLLMQSYEETLLYQTYRAVIERQIDYARAKGVPWGVSESGYYRFDNQQNYQYRGFGVPGLGRKRGLGDDLVITPYASLLALPIRPQAVLENLTRLAAEQMFGHYGLYEAIDYTASRLPLGQEQAIVRSYMSHHQGMIMLALANTLEDDIIVRYFHNHPLAQSVELLLQEQIPHHAPVEALQDEAVDMTAAYSSVDLGPWHASPHAPVPYVHLLSNGTYNVLITAAGSGYSYYVPQASAGDENAPLQSSALTRWRADTTLDDWGTWIYVQDRESGDLWSACHQPTIAPVGAQEVLFYPYKAEFRQRAHDITSRTEVAVAADDNVEIRRVVLTNHERRPRKLSLTSYAEVVLAPQATDRRHPAFNKLFIESEYVPEIDGLLFHRRARSAEETPLYLVHLLLFERRSSKAVVAPPTYETDRARFLGRGQTPRSPVALTSGQPRLSGTTGATLDPIMALSQEIELGPHEEVSLAYVTLAAASHEEALNLAQRYRVWPRIERAFDQARAQSERELRQLGFDTQDLEPFQKLLSVLLYPHGALRADQNTLAENEKGQSGLWPYAISGDYPILLVRVDDEEEIALVQQALQAHTYWRDRQMKVDLVILNQRDEGYDQELQGRLNRLMIRMDSENWLGQRGGIFLLRAAQVGHAGQVLLETAARAILDGGRGSLGGQLGALQEYATRLPRFVPTASASLTNLLTPSVDRPSDLQFDNGLGGFTPDGREYVIYLRPGERTPAPWINVIANPEFGFMVSESGSGYTWAGNSSENRLTPWRNDPVSDLPSEALYLRDEETADVWSPTPAPTPASAPYLIRHGTGYTTFEHHSHGLKQRLRLFAAHDAPVKVVQLHLDNVWDRARRITVTFYAEWVLGTDRDTTQQYIVPEYDSESHTLLARNAYSEEFSTRVAFLTVDKALHGLTTDRTEFLERNGSLRHPVALERIGLSGTVRAGVDPCAALQVHLDLQPGESQEVVFLLGQGADRHAALELVKQYRDPGEVARAWEDVRTLWDDLLGTVTVKTPDPAMDVLLNRWLLYQALSCRIWARSAFYQSSGAFGFRDQLQDVMALVYAAPHIVREHILRAAQHQFEAGDVLHWWHPPSGRGVRTRITDDLLWLPFITAHYVEATGDTTILDEEVPFRVGDPLKDGEDESYGHYALTEEGYTLYDHCRRALQKGTTAGPHDLPLMGTGDWNDGMNRVGIGGQGESVWLGWFLYATLTRFAVLCEHRGDADLAATYRERAEDLRQALNEHAWDGAWYLRAFYDDGTPLGSAESDECRIDSLAQSWAVLSGAGDPDRASQAMASVVDNLVRRDDDLILLFTPPFDQTGRDPGYIKGYPPGIRENGGQYTHAALWAVWALAKMGRGDLAAELFGLLNPIHHADTPEKVMRYRVEPYVIAADVYSVAPHVGRGGWTWYTGSSGWMYRLGVEAILGLHRTGDALRIDPCIPKEWPSYEVTYRDGETVYHIHVENPDGECHGVTTVTLDGEPVEGNAIPLLADGNPHEVHVVIEAHTSS
ncbi:MAG: GH36-type glycosyl hydrolase domain-containing protein, partial [Anaerolineae bacterium]